MGKRTLCLSSQNLSRYFYVQTGKMIQMNVYEYRGLFWSEDTENPTVIPGGKLRLIPLRMLKFLNISDCFPHQRRRFPHLVVLFLQGFRYIQMNFMMTRQTWDSIHHNQPPQSSGRYRRETDCLKTRSSIPDSHNILKKQSISHFLLC